MPRDIEIRLSDDQSIRRILLHLMFCYPDIHSLIVWYPDERILGSLGILRFLFRYLGILEI